MADNLRDAAKAKEKGDKVAANLWGLQLEETYIVSGKTYEYANNLKVFKPFVQYTRVPGGWVRERFIRKINNGAVISQNTTFIPYVALCDIDTRRLSCPP